MITPILNLNLAYAKPQKNSKPGTHLSLRPQLNADIVSFGNKKPDLMSQSDKNIFDEVINAIDDWDNMLGRGGEAYVYRIGDSGYCVRYVHSGPKLPLKLSDFSRQVSKQDRINHVVARIGKLATIMPILPGVPVWTAFMQENEICKIASDIEKLPQSAFNKLLKQINKAYKNDMMWDFNWANLIVDKDAKTLTAIDFHRNTENEAANHLAYMFGALTHEYTTERQCKVNAEKIMNAGLEEFKPGIEPCCKFDYFGFRDFIWELSELKLFTNEKYITLLSDLTDKIKKLKIKECQGQDVTNELNGQIKVIKAIMRQLVKY